MIPCDINKGTVCNTLGSIIEEARDLPPLYKSPARVWDRPPSYAMGTLIQFPSGVNQPETKVVFLPPSSAKVKNNWR